MPASLALLARLCAAHAHRESGSFSVVASRRTPDAWRASLSNVSADIPGIRWRDERDGPNPYAGLLAHADRIACTPDSVNMLSEAAATLAPVFVWSADIACGRLARVPRCAACSRGRVRDLDDALHRSRSTPLRETARVAECGAGRFCGWRYRSPDPASNCNPCARTASRIASRASVDAFVEGHSARTPVQRAAQAGIQQRGMRDLQGGAGVGIEQSGIVQRIEDRRRRTASHACASAVRSAVAQQQELQQEFQVDQPAVALLEVEQRGIAAVQFGAHAPAHRRPRRRAASCRIDRRAPARRARTPSKARSVRHRRRPRARAPAPGVPRSRHVRAGSRRSWPGSTPAGPCAIRAQAHVDVVQAAGAGAAFPARRRSSAPAARTSARHPAVARHPIRAFAASYRNTRSRSEPKPSSSPPRLP
jgi:hypothetical protein